MNKYLVLFFGGISMFTISCKNSSVNNPTFRRKEQKEPKKKLFNDMKNDLILLTTIIFVFYSCKSGDEQKYSKIKSDGIYGNETRLYFEN
jgi:hypothetical protein